MVQLSFSTFPSQDPAMAALRRKIRNGSEPDNPTLIHVWLDAEASAPNLQEREQRWQLHCASFRLLLDSFCDDLVASHWRCLCLDHICRPLSELNHLADSEEKKQTLRALYHELRVSSQYFRPRQRSSTSL